MAVLEDYPGAFHLRLRDHTFGDRSLALTQRYVGNLFSLTAHRATPSDRGMRVGGRCQRLDEKASKIITFTKAFGNISFTYFFHAA